MERRTSAGELVGGMLIVGARLPLVISFWARWPRSRCSQGRAVQWRDCSAVWLVGMYTDRTLEDTSRRVHAAC